MNDSALAALPDWAAAVVDTTKAAGESIPRALEIARTTGKSLPQPGRGDTLSRWAVLSAIAAANLTVARVLEAHSDALAILDEAGEDADEHTTWGVFAAESADTRLTASGTTGDVTLTGVKPWCSLAAELDAALVTAHGPDGRQLFRVDLRQDTVRPQPAAGWVARGLRTVTSAPVHFDGALARPVGAPGWYLTRPGFAYGGIGVAACWYGGASALVARLEEKAAKGNDLDRMHLGAADVALHAAGATLRETALKIDDGAANEQMLALRVRSIVADAVERVLRHAAHALGPAPLAFDKNHAARVADLEIYVRQHHAERDLAALGALLTEPQ